jgi:DNA primase catalytic core
MMAKDSKPPLDRLYAVNAAAVRFYTDRLRTSRKAAAYLRSHGIIAAADPDTPWQVGYAPRPWTGLATHLQGAGFTSEEVTAAGLGFIHRTSGHLLDRFRERLMFPVTDENNRVVAFTARDLSGRAEAKWLNSPETIIYRKKERLYGLGQQLMHRPVGGGDPVVFLVEGAADVLAVHRMAQAHAMFPGSRPVYAVAPCGTNLTREQLDLLQKTLPDAHLILTFDGDDAGRKAIGRAYPIAVRWPGELSGACLPVGQDPADMLAANGPLLAVSEIVGAVQPLAQIQMTNTIEDLFARGRITDPANYATDRITAYRAIAELFIDAPNASRQMAEAAAEQLSLTPTDVVRGVIEAWEARTAGHDADSPAAPDTEPASAPAGPTANRPGDRQPDTTADIPPPGRKPRATVSASARSTGTRASESTAVATRHDDARGITVWALADAIGHHPEAFAAASMVVDIATTVAVRSAPAAGVNAARAAINAFYGGVHPNLAGDASLIVVAAYPARTTRHGVRFELAWVGDCRAYTIRGGQLAQVTADHTTARYRRDAGEPVQVGSVADALLTSSVRAGDISVCPLEQGALLLCNNTLHRAVPATRLAAELAETSDARASADRLVAAAGSHHARDAVAVVVHAASAPPFRVTTTGSPRPIVHVSGSAAALAKISFTSPPTSSPSAAATRPTDRDTARASKTRRR